MSRTATSSGSNPLKRLVKAAKDGLLSADDIEQLDAMLCQKTSLDERISRLRFAFRLQRWVKGKGAPWLISHNLESEIAEIYREQFSLTSNPSLKFRYARWAERWGDENFDWKHLKATLMENVKAETNLPSKLAAIRDADLRFEILGEELEPRTQILSKILWSRMDSMGTGLEFGSWSCGLRSLQGPKPPNQDAVMFAAFSDDSFLVAIADGTGDSHDGARAAEVALQTLTDSLAATGQLKESTELAASAVRADNLERKEENSCTLVAIHVKKENAALVHLSDPFHWIQADGAPPFHSRLDKSQRANVGGEPFGYTLTSSGNRVDCFLMFPPTPNDALQEITGMRAFVLGCDGLLPFSDTELSNDVCPIVVDYAEGKKHPYRIAQDCCVAAYKAMDEQRRGPDNITCIAGYQKR